MRVKRDPGYFYIKVKILSLAAEAKIIRKQEQIARHHRDRTRRIGLAGHRRGIVRREARHALLAYAFLRGTPYKTVEAKCHDNDKPDFKKVLASLEKYMWARRYDDLSGEWENLKEWESRQKQGQADFAKWGRFTKKWDMAPFDFRGPVFIPYEISGISELKRMQRLAYRRFYFRGNYLRKKFSELAKPGQLVRYSKGLEILLKAAFK